MDFNFSNALSSVNGFLGQNNGLSALANNVLSGLGPKPAPKVVQQAPAQIIQLPPSASPQGMSKGMMMGIGAGVIGLVLVVVLVAFKRK